MKKWKYLVVFFAAMLLLSVTAGAEEMGEDAAEPIFEIEYEGTADLFQCGSFVGEYTKPDEVSLFAEDQVYQNIYNGLKNRNTQIILQRTGVAATDATCQEFCNDVVAAFERVVNDHPELFYVGGGYRVGASGQEYNIICTFTPDYYWLATDAEINNFNQKLNEVVNSARLFSDQLEQALWVHDYLAVNCAYNWAVATTGKETSKQVFSAYAALVEGDAVCQGYALAYKLVLNRLGLECITVTSTPMNHMWNMVRLNGNWYHVDVTWDDPTPDTQGSVNHDFFLLSDDTIRDEKHQHEGWPQSVTCRDTSYESGYIFNNTKYPIYYWNGNYYFITGNENCQLWRSGSLSSAGTHLYTMQLFAQHIPIDELRYYICDVNGVVWLDDMVFYVDMDKQVTSYNLSSGTTRVIGTVEGFTPMAYLNIYESTRDGIGLRYDSVKDQIIARSPTQRRDLGSFEIPQYPPEWDKIQEVKILGMTDDNKKAGVYCRTSGMTLWEVYYRDGKMVSARQHTINGTGLQLVELGTAPSGCQMELFLLTANQAPACAAYKAA